MLRKFIESIAKSAVDEVVRDRLPQMLDDKIPGIIESHLERRFAAEPGLALTEAGFGWAMMLALRKRWPDIDRDTATRWMWEYLTFAGITFGDPDYEWTPSAADELAEAYSREFCEEA